MEIFHKAGSTQSRRTTWSRDVKWNRLGLTLLLLWAVAVIPLAAQKSKADPRPLEAVKSKAEAGDANSQGELGRRYANGYGVKEDLAEAAKWYRKAAEQNVAAAQRSMGYSYEKGRHLGSAKRAGNRR